jgi:hypothetical protein
MAKGDQTDNLLKFWLKLQSLVFSLKAVDSEKSIG